MVTLGGMGCAHPAHLPKLIVLGVDGMDPAFVERHWSALPNLAKLRDDGVFTRLATTTPPQSPVAWSSFITGVAPAEHGIYDFVHRDAATLQPFSSLSRTEEPRFTLPLGAYVLPLSSSRVTSLRRGTPFWQLLSERGVPVDVVRMPTNYPPTPVGHALAGMGVPDLGGTLGTFTFYSDDPEEFPRAVAGGHIVKVQLDNGHTVLPIEGPPNTLRKDHRVATADVLVDVDPRHPVMRLELADQLVVLREGEWSDWLAADFPLIPHLSSVRGIFRVYVKQLHPRLAIYVSAINVDPLEPALPVSYPANWSREVASRTGRFFTMGTPEDTAALRQNVLTLDEFRAQTRLVFDEEQRLLRDALSHFNSGLLFFYFSSIDQNSHMLWGRHEAELLEVYRAVDQAIGEARRAVPDAELMVMSDHGFTTFDRAAHLNTWLAHRGFLSARESLGAADWASTEAYAMGLNGLYLNMKGREPHGTVEAGGRAALIGNLREQLVAWRDPLNGRQVVEVVDENPAAAQNAAVAPDLIVGYARGYRGSWQTALGGVPETELDNNDDAWIGDHCINPADVPGVLFTSSKNRPAHPAIQDVTALVLQRYGITLH